MQFTARYSLYAWGKEQQMQPGLTASCFYHPQFKNKQSRQTLPALERRTDKACFAVDFNELILAAFME